MSSLFLLFLSPPPFRSCFRLLQPFLLLCHVIGEIFQQGVLCCFDRNIGELTWKVPENWLFDGITRNVRFGDKSGLLSFDCFQLGGVFGLGGLAEGLRNRPAI